MSAPGEQPHFSTRLLDLGLKLQDVPWLGRWATQADTPAYIRLHWESMPDIDPDSVNWTEDVPGDPDAGLLSRNWNNAAVLGVSRQALASLGAPDPEHHRSARDVVVYDHGGVVVAGMNPESSRIFGNVPAWYNGDDILTVAMRRGRGPLRAAMGHFSQDRGLLIPEGTLVVQESIPTEKTVKKFPHTPLV